MFLLKKKLPLLYIALLCGLAGVSQVPVREEPFHQPVYETPKVRLLNVLLHPGDTSAYHVHSSPTLLVFFTNTMAGSQLPGLSATSSRMVAGRLFFEDLSSPREKIHRVWNQDSIDLHVMAVEILPGKFGFTLPPITRPDLVLEVDTPTIRAYRLRLNEQESISLRHPHRNLILVSMMEGKIEFRTNSKKKLIGVKEGSFIPITRKLSGVKNIGRGSIDLTLIELTR